MKTLSADALQKALHDGQEIALIDVREDGEFGEGHLLFATPLPYSRLELGITALVPRHDVRIVLCDGGSGAVAESAARRLAALGYSNVYGLEGGTVAWEASGRTLFKGVNVPSKLFGEMVEHAYHTPRITAQDLVRMKQNGERFHLFDGRPLHEHHKMTIPGSTCCPNAELPYRVSSMVDDPAVPIIVNCAGRTRSIIGAQTLINFGIPNPVYALENGTQGWFLADLDLEYGSQKQYPADIAANTLPQLKEKAEALMTRFGIASVSSATVNQWLCDASRTTYLCDIRTPEEFARGSLPGAQHAPGGQLIQATDQWVGVRHARIVVFDGGECVRAPVVASWLKQLGCDVTVLAEGNKASITTASPQTPALPVLPSVTPDELDRQIQQKAVTVLDLGSSMRFRKQHIPGSHWSIRRHIVRDVRQHGHQKPVVLIGDDDALVRLYAIDLLEAGLGDIRLLSGGLSTWQAAGYPVFSSDNIPPDNECIDYLFFVHDRHAGNREAMKQYLAWETGLMQQLDAQDRSVFVLPDHHA